MGRKRSLDQLDPGVRLAVEAMGNMSNLARGLYATPQSISAWGPIPPRRVLEVEELTGVPRHRLRPDLYTRSGKRRNGA